MVGLIVGALVLFVFLGGLRAFERAQVGTIKSLLIWVAALGGLCLAVLLAVTGRETLALGGLSLLGPLIWQQLRGAGQGRPQGSGPGSRAGTGSSSGPPPRRPSGAMSVDEAWQVLGLQPGADEAAIRAAHRRLMRAAHPDSGGSDWLATRINQARDILLSVQR